MLVESHTMPISSGSREQKSVCPGTAHVQRMRSPDWKEEEIVHSHTNASLAESKLSSCVY